MKDEKREIRLTREQARAIDKLATEKYRMPTMLLMENAARGAADVVENILQEHPSAVSVLVGPGNNGGDGLAIARHLHNRGHHVQIFLLGDAGRFKDDALVNWNIVQAMQMRHERLTDESKFIADVLIDALFGTGITEPPRDPFAEIAAAVNSSGIPVIAIDIPSGLDCDTGAPIGPVAIRARHTITFVAEKVGFANPAAAAHLGQIAVVDIGCPKECIGNVINQK